MSCRLCLIKHEDGNHLFSDVIKGTALSDVILLHFGFMVLTDEQLPKIICETCFQKIKEFHVFYLDVKDLQYITDFKTNEHKLFEKPLSTESDADPLTLIEAIQLPQIKIEQDDTHQESSTSDNEYVPNESDDNNDDSYDYAYSTDVLDEQSSDKKKHFKQNEYVELDQKFGEFYKMQCELCETVCITFSELKKHFMSFHKNKKPYVRCCKRKLSNYSVLMEHLMWHQNPEEFSCKPCKKVFTNKYILKMHNTDVHTDAQKHKCLICNMEFARVNKLNLHLRRKHVPDILKGIECDQCPFRFTTESGLKSHVKHVHLGVEEHICDICGKIFKSVSLCRSHYKATHDNNPCECEFCGMIIKTEVSYRKHVRRMHGGSISCTICGKIVHSKYSLDAHMSNVHTRKPTFQCTYCDKAFKYSVKLKEHIATHTGIDLYTCSFCPRTFKCTANVIKHKKHMHLAEYEAEKLQRQMEIRKKMS